jgi:hypothetical protein
MIATFEATGGAAYLQRVWFVPSIKKNVVSVSSLSL